VRETSGKHVPGKKRFLLIRGSLSARLSCEVRQTRILNFFFLFEREQERKHEQGEGEGEADCPLSGEPDAGVLFKNTLLLNKQTKKC